MPATACRIASEAPDACGPAFQREPARERSRAGYIIRRRASGESFMASAKVSNATQARR